MSISFKDFINTLNESRKTNFVINTSLKLEEKPKFSLGHLWNSFKYWILTKVNIDKAKQNDPYQNIRAFNVINKIEEYLNQHSLELFFNKPNVIDELLHFQDRLGKKYTEKMDTLIDKMRKTSFSWHLCLNGFSKDLTNSVYQYLEDCLEDIYSNALAFDSNDPKNSPLKLLEQCGEWQAQQREKQNQIIKKDQKTSLAEKSLFKEKINANSKHLFNFEKEAKKNAYFQLALYWKVRKDPKKMMNMLKQIIEKTQLIIKPIDLSFLGEDELLEYINYLRSFHRSRCDTEIYEILSYFKDKMLLKCPEKFNKLFEVFKKKISIDEEIIYQ